MTAFAQLVVYRLAATRALISLFDRDRQHIVAEATRNSPVAANEPPYQSDNRDTAQNTSAINHDDNREDEGADQFWLCGTAIPRSYGICEHVLTSTENPSTTAAPTGPAKGIDNDDLPVSVIPDLAIDARFQSRPYVHMHPFNRFYAGIPIRTPGPDGINIGVLCVFSTKPRLSGLDKEAVTFMQDMSRTIMSYLECRIAQKHFRCSERMNRGMGNFVEGLDSLASSAVSAGSAIRSTAHSKRSSRIVDSGESTQDQRRPIDRLKRPLALLPNTVPDSSRVIDDALLSPHTLATAGNPASRPLTSVVPEESSRSSTPRPGSQQSQEGGVQPAALSEVSTADLQLAQSGRVFAKAANIIRQSLEVDGVLFLDATVRSFGGLVGQQSERKVSAVGNDNLNYLSNDEDSSNHTPSAANTEDCCNILGFSTPDASSIGGNRVPWQFEGLRDRTLQRLLRRYPQGQIFNYEADGSILQTPLLADGEPMTPGLPPSTRPILPSRQWSQESQEPAEGPGEVNAKQQILPSIQKQRWNAAESIARLFPGARSVVIVPLWDSQKKRWAAGGFAWTNNPTQDLSVDGTLAFLRVFGLIVMAEIYRLNTKAEETIKSNILGSISHELRSPLHGLVGACSLLNDSKLDAVQQNVLNIIETSGKTLVDTINHLLDYSKINSFIESDRADKKDTGLGKVGAEPTERSVQEKARSQTLPVELDCLVEEVVESVLAGYSHERLSRPHVARDSTQYGRYGFPFESHSTASTNIADSPQDRVQIYLDIEPSTSWRFRTHPGAFRRIVMNLFGNSLKFTKSGFIKISLAQEPAKSYQQSSHATVLLTVTDSGKGISEDYLRNHLFTPFCQEDNFAPGTGLGLSLVRQITINLGGEIKVASQVGRGTAITVSLPLPNTSEGLASLDLMGPKQDLTSFKGRKVLLRGFDNVQTSDCPSSVRASDDIGKPRDSQFHYICRNCRFLQLEVLSEAEAQTQQPDFIIHQNSTISFAEAEIIGAQAPCPVLFVCDASVAVRNFSANLPDAASRIRTFEFFSAPLGPRKLAKGLTHLESMWKVKQEQSESTQEVEVSNHVVTVVQSNKVTASPLPTPPDEPSIKYPLSKSELVASPVAEGSSRVPSVLIVDDNAINLRVSSASKYCHELRG